MLFFLQSMQTKYQGKNTLQTKPCNPNLTNQIKYLANQKPNTYLRQIFRFIRLVSLPGTRKINGISLRFSSLLSYIPVAPEGTATAEHTSHILSCPMYHYAHNNWELQSVPREPTSPILSLAPDKSRGSPVYVMVLVVRGCRREGGGSRPMSFEPGGPVY